MKIAVTGKGGVGKTTVAAILARLYADEGHKVLAADVDPDANLGAALGFTQAELDEITPISKMRKLIAERTGAGADTYGKFFKINPRVDDIPDMVAKEKNGVKLLVLGTVETGGSGCVCPEHVVMKRIISHLILRREDVVIMDMEAGLEHLGRGTTDMMDEFIAVVEPGTRSVQTYHQIRRLAGDLGVKTVRVVANKGRSPADEEFVRANIPPEALLGIVRFSEDVSGADRAGRSPYEFSPDTVAEIRAIKDRIDEESAASGAAKPEI
jgi:CO dehydrogenase maturation factor